MRFLKYICTMKIFKNLIFYILICFIILIMLPGFIAWNINKADKEEKNNFEYPIREKPVTLPVTLKVYIKDEDKIKEIELEEYIKGVVAAEMPANFELEALKAQAVVARTYAYSRLNKKYVAIDNPHPQADICTDSTHCQAWISRNNAELKWQKNNFKSKWERIEEAVNKTKGIIIKYKDNTINAVYHSHSGGQTENAEDVWDCAEVPYLKSVSGMEEINVENHEDIVIISNKVFADKIKKEFPYVKINEKSVFNDIRIIDYSQGGGVKNILIGNILFTGAEFRDIFSLKSTKMSIEKNKNESIKITTVGNGHGVGMSQWGANCMANNGRKWDEILAHYYKEIDICSIYN